MTSFGRRRFLALAAGAIAAACKGAVPGSSSRTAGPDTRGPVSLALAYVPNSTVKVEQVVGDFDKERHEPTINQTEARYGIAGTDLGNSFEHNGKTYFTFGDTVLT